MSESILSPASVGFVSRPLDVDTLASRRPTKKGRISGNVARNSALTSSRQRGLGPSSRVLIVGENTDSIRAVRKALTDRGISSRIATTGAQGFKQLVDWHPDAILAELSMYCKDGSPLWREALKHFRIPVLVVSALGDELVKVEILEGGAVDYIVKPFSVREVAARIWAQIRQAHLIGTASTLPEFQRIEIGHFTIDNVRHNARVRGIEVHLTPREFELLAFLAAHPDALITHSMLAKLLWGDSEKSVLQIRVLVSELRKKIELTEHPRYILTEFRLGYRFVPAPTEPPPVAN